MRNPFSKEDYFEFIGEREKSIKNFIKSNIIEDKIELPLEFKRVNDDIENLELKLRDEVESKLSQESYKDLIPQHIIDKVSRRIENELKKNPSLSIESFNSIRKKLNYFDLQELCDVIISNKTWDIYEEKFRDKTQLMDKFRKLGDLRNGIRHSRGVDEVTMLEGQAAIIWFNKILN